MGSKATSFIINTDINKNLNNLKNENIIKDKIGYVYIASNLNYIKQNKYNIGCTNDLIIRKRNKNNPFTVDDKIFFQITIYCDFKDYDLFEKEIHTELRDFRNSTADYYFNIKYSILVKFL